MHQYNLLCGEFFEDINLGADGGMYAELVKNRSFEFSKPLMGWKTEGKVKEGISWSLTADLNLKKIPDSYV